MNAIPRCARPALACVAAGLLLFGLTAIRAAAQEHKSDAATSSAEHAPATADTAHATDNAGAHGGAAHADSHHDTTDLSHGNASAALASPADFRFDMAIYTFLVFLILLGVLYKFAWGPISKALDEREAAIARQIAEAKAASELAGKQLKEYEARLAAATEESRAIVTQARQDAEAAKERIVAEAQAAASKERERAVADIAAAKNQALREIAEKSVNTAIGLASNIVRREVRPEDHTQLINESLQQFTKLN